MNEMRKNDDAVQIIKTAIPTAPAATGFDALAGRIESVTTALQEDAKAVINRSVTARAWLTGYYIVEYEQHGSDRAKYGEGLLKALAKRLGADKFSYPSLKNYRQFYLAYPELSNPIAAYLFERFGKGLTVSSRLPEGLWNYGNEPLWNCVI